MGIPILILFCAFAFWLIRRDIAHRDGISNAIWIPTLWAWIVLSKPMSAWVGFGGGINTLDGSPLDRYTYLALILAAAFILLRRAVNPVLVISKNWPIFVFYGFFLISVVWAYSSEAAFKRIFKDFGNVLIALVILTEANPSQAIRAVFWRCAIVLVPLSWIFIRWFPDLGRRYSPHSGGLEIVGVTTQKNELGPLVVVCGLVLLWDWIENRKSTGRQPRVDRYVSACLLVSSLYLLYSSDSKTSIVALLLGAAVLFSPHLSFLRGRVGAIGKYVLFGAIGFYILNATTGIAETIVSALGRDMTFTGRTNVWSELLSLNTDSLLGVGFCSFWSDPRYITNLSEGLGHTAHNGYLEMYLDGGWLGVTVLAILLLATAVRFNAALASDTHYSRLRFAVLIAILIGSFFESHFARMSSLWFLFLLVAIEPSSVPVRSTPTYAYVPRPEHRFAGVRM